MTKKVREKACLPPPLIIQTILCFSLRKEPFSQIDYNPVATCKIIILPTFCEEVARIIHLEIRVILVSYPKSGWCYQSLKRKKNAYIYIAKDEHDGKSTHNFILLSKCGWHHHPVKPKSCAISSLKRIQRGKNAICMHAIHRLSNQDTRGRCSSLSFLQHMLETFHPPL